MEDTPIINIAFAVARSDFHDFDRDSVTKMLGLEPTVSRGYVELENGAFKSADWYIKINNIASWTIREALGRLEALLEGKREAVLNVQRQLDVECTVSICIHCPGDDLPELFVSPESMSFWGSMHTAIGIDLYTNEADETDEDAWWEHL